MLIALSRLPLTPRPERESAFYPVKPEGFDFDDLPGHDRFKVNCSRSLSLCFIA
jgi:hypothetical protein